MTTLIVVLIIITVGCAGFLLFALLAGAAVTTSAFDQAIDDREQEKWIREYMEEKERKSGIRKPSGINYTNSAGLFCRIGRTSNYQKISPKSTLLYLPSERKCHYPEGRETKGKTQDAHRGQERRNS